MTDDLPRLLAILRARLIAARTMAELSTIQQIIDDYTGGIDPRWEVMPTVAGAPGVPAMEHECKAAS